MSLLEHLWRKGRVRFEGRSTRRPDAARRRFLMEELEPRTVLSSSVLSGTAGADAILIRRDPAYPAKIEVQIGTSSRISLGLVAGDTLTINAGGGNDTFYIWDTFAGVTLRVNGEGDNDTFN